MILGSRVPRIGEVVGAFFGGEGAEEFTDGCGQGLDRPGGRLAQKMLELGEDLLDRVQVRGVFGQEEQLGASLTNGLADSFAFVAAEIVHDDEIARPQGGRQNLLDICLERCGVDRTIEKPRRLDTIATKRSNESRGLPMTVRNLGDKAGPKR